MVHSSEMPPSPRPGFESELIGEVEGFVAAIPVGAARLRIGRVKRHPEWPEPDFEITPTNPKAARFGGYAVMTDLYLAIGGAEREFCGFAQGGNIISGASWQQELRWIWQAVVAGGFTQRHYLDPRGNVIGAVAKIAVNGKHLVIRNGRRAARLFGRERVEEVTFEPYLTG